ncbi:MAG: YceI family protein [Solimonas sp.]
MLVLSRLLAAILAVALVRPAEAAEPFKIGADRGTIEFSIGDSRIFRTTGSFKNWHGYVNVDDADVPKSTVEVVVDTGSIELMDSQQTAILRDTDFFAVAQFPLMTFRSTKIERRSGNTLKVEGDVTLRGVTRPMTLDVTVSDRQSDASSGARYARFRGVGTINRSEFGMTKFTSMVGDTVEISITTDAWR